MLASRRCGFLALASCYGFSCAIVTATAASMSDDYERGRRDGLRLAIAILAAEEAKWAALLGQSRSWRTNATRVIRHKALQIAQARLGTALGRLTPKADAGAVGEELATALEKLGL